MYARRTPELSILIVSYNTRAMTLACLDSIAAETTATRYEIIVVDNASTDGSADAIAAHSSAPRLIASTINHGFAQGNNIAAREARGDFILLLNPDTVVTNAAIDKLMAFARRSPEAKIWGGRTTFADGRLNPSSCWRRITLWNVVCRATGFTGFFKDSPIFNSEAYGGWARDTEREVDIVSGCFLLVPRTLWNKLGGFDRAFFMYGEEADFCLQARKFGARPRVTPEASIIHLGGASEATRAGKMVKLLAAKSLLIRRHWSPAMAWLGIGLLAAWPLSRAIAMTMAAIATRKPVHIESAQTWREIWRRRGEWIGGFPLAEARMLPPVAASRV
jgi:GT2 family glycosyltransferase